MFRDVLSLYEEQVESKRDNDIYNRALVIDRDVDAALFDTIDRAMMSVNAVTDILQGQEQHATCHIFQKLTQHFTTWRLDAN